VRQDPAAVLGRARMPPAGRRTSPSATTWSIRRAARGCGGRRVVERRAAGPLRHEPLARSGGHCRPCLCETLRHDPGRAGARAPPADGELGRCRRTLRPSAPSRVRR
jgi:hypothetical protein